MPQKKPAKKIAKPAAKKTVQSKKAMPKSVKKSVPVKKKKTAVKLVKPVAKAKSKPAAPKKGASKAVGKSVKKIKKVAAPVKSVPAKHAHKPVAVVHKPAKQKETMVKPKKQEQKPVSPAKKVVKKQEPMKEVKLPKITAKTSVPYHPSYKSMEQRQEVARPNEPLVRYNDNELNEFRELIQKKLDSSKKELAYLQGLITRKDDMGGDESENRYMTMEDGSISMEREQLSQMASRQITFIDHLEKALIRIENKTYGICRVTGRLIDKARLRAVPHATLSLEAKLGLVKTGE
ncbi:MAG: TraR/DksA C4-type zinc finger protein [Parafilimonas sp.]